MLTVRWKSVRAQTLFGLLAIALVLMWPVSSAFGQSSTTSTSNDSYYTSYFGNVHVAGYPDSDLVIVNPGSLAGYSVNDGQPAPYGDLCANIYVFAADQQMAECCSCQVSPNTLRLLSFNTHLTANALTGNPPTAGQVKIVSSDGTKGCTVSGKVYDVAAITYSPKGSLRAWNTHARQTATGFFTVSETAFHAGYLSSSTYSETADFSYSSELLKLQQQCYSTQTIGGGQGRCTCGTIPQ